MFGSPRRTGSKLAIVVTLALVAAGLPSLSTALAGNPEIVDKCGDVDPAATLRPEVLNATRRLNATAYDLLDVGILFETRDHVILAFHACDLPDSWDVALPENVTLPVGPNASQPMVRFVANFTVQGVSHEVSADLAAAGDAALRDAYTVRTGDKNTSVSGAVNGTRDLVFVQVPKALIGSPARGDRLSLFRAEAWAGPFRVDFAPDAERWYPDAPAMPGDPSVPSDPPPLPGAPPALEEPDAADQVDPGHPLYIPKYGRDYVFGNYASGTGLRLTSRDTVHFVPAGQATTFYLNVSNQASVQDRIVLALDEAPAGFAHHLSDTDFLLAPGASKTVSVQVSSDPDKSGNVYSMVSALTSDGAEGTFLFATRFLAPGAAAPGSPDDPDYRHPGNSGSGASPTPAPGGKGGIPGFETVFVLAGLAVGAVALARRRK